MYAMRGSVIACDRTVGVDPVALATRPRSLTASRVFAASTTMYVPAGYVVPSAMNAVSATATRPAAFHGNTADRQSPTCLTRSVPPVPLTRPATVALAVTGRIGFERIDESAIVYVSTCRSSSIVQPVSSYGDGSSGL